MNKFLSLVVVIVILAMPSAQAASLKGGQGQLLTVSATTAKNGSMVTVRGNRFDETVGIYLAFCVVPKKGELPTPCGGGVNKAGTGESSFWISSNPPPYAVGLTDEFLPGGRFTHTVKISKKIGKFDCTKIKCAITVRADHLRGNDRSYDMFVPVKIK
jgi:opacity protein-like surface antigen